MPIKISEDTEFTDVATIAEALRYAASIADVINGSWVLPQESLEAMLSKSLIYKGSLYPLASMFRCRKFIARGWRITAGQMLKIAHQISNVDLNDRAVLREQLIGVDMAYMEQLLTALQNHKGKIDETYLAQLVDEIFE